MLRILWVVPVHPVYTIVMGVVNLDIQRGNYFGDWNDYGSGSRSKDYWVLNKNFSLSLKSLAVQWSYATEPKVTCE